MPDVFAFDDINDEFGNVLGMVADSFNRFSNKQQIKARRNGARVFHHVGDQLANEPIKLFVNLVVFLQD